MSKSVSPKPFNLSEIRDCYRQLRGWQRLSLELMIIAVVFFGLSSWSSRHLLQEGEKLPELIVSTLEGEPVTLAAPSHERTLVYVFAPWCSICRISMPGLSLIERPSMEQVALALDYDSVEEVSQFIEDVGFTGKVYLGNSSVAKALNIQGYPSYYLLNADGDIIHRAQGLSTPPGIWLNSL